MARQPKLKGDRLKTKLSLSVLDNLHNIRTRRVGKRRKCLIVQEHFERKNVRRRAFPSARTKQMLVNIQSSPKRNFLSSVINKNLDAIRTRAMCPIDFGFPNLTHGNHERPIQASGGPETARLNERIPDGHGPHPMGIRVMVLKILFSTRRRTIPVF